MGALLIIMLIAILGLIIAICILRSAHANEKEDLKYEYEEMIKSIREQESKKNETKEKMETGDSRTDFNNSMDIMSDLVERSR